MKGIFYQLHGMIDRISLNLVDFEVDEKDLKSNLKFNWQTQN